MKYILVNILAIKLSIVKIILKLSAGTQTQNTNRLKGHDKVSQYLTTFHNVADFNPYAAGG